MAQLEKELMNFCLKNPMGVKQQQIQAELIDGSDKYTLMDLALAINSLTNKGRLTLFRHEGVCIWRPVAEDKANKLISLTQQERIVYAAIEKENNKGIWIKDLRKRTNIMGQGVLEKILKSLVTRKYIKAEESIAGKNKKVYMLYELTPSLEVTGGTFYKGHDMDIEFVSAMQKACRIMVKRHGPQTASEVMGQMKNLNVINVPYTLQDIVTVLNTLVMDRELEVVSHENLPPQTKAEYLKRQARRANAAEAAEIAAAAAKEKAATKSRKKRRVEGMSSVHDNDDDDDDDDATDEEAEESGSADEEDDVDYDDDDDEVEKVYMAANSNMSYINEHFVAGPCVGCHLMPKCKPGNVIEPQTCLYFKQWLADEF